jgi:hypothetical protein
MNSTRKHDEHQDFEPVVCQGCGEIFLEEGPLCSFCEEIPTQPSGQPYVKEQDAQDVGAP